MFWKNRASPRLEEKGWTTNEVGIFDMAALTILFRLVLAAVFLVGSLAKLSDVSTTRHALKNFGIPLKLANILSVALPVAELLVGAGLMVTATAWWSALAAGILLTSFAVAIGVNLSMGRKPDCNCFGRVHSAPIGKETLALNLFLLTGAVFLISRRDLLVDADFRTVTAWFTTPELIAGIALVLVCAALAMLTWFLLQLYRQNGRLLTRIEALEQRAGVRDQNAMVSASSVQPTRVGLAPGSVAPAFELEMLDGGRITSATLIGRGEPLLLLFIDAGCSPCTSMIPTFAKWHAEYASVFTTVIVSRGSPEVNRDKLAHHKIGHFLLQKDVEVATAYQCYGTPGAVLVDSQGRIASYLAQGSRGIEDLVADSYQQLVGKASAVKAGSLVPDLALREISGKPIKLTDFKGTPLLLLFWNPACGYCSRMINELILWEKGSVGATPSLLLISRGSAEENRQLGLRSPIVLDYDFSVGRTFGVGGTPSAVLINEAGLLVSKRPAVGADQVLSLLGYEKSDMVVAEMAASGTGLLSYAKGSAHYTV